MPLLSVIIIVKNEADRIETCLRSVAWADEIIVLDSGSVDDTVERCKKYTNKIFIMDWPGFGLQKNRALEKATSDWILSIDADECVDEKFQKEIADVLRNSNPNIYAYSFPRFSSYLGKTLKHGDWKNDYCVRLFKRGYAHFSDDIVHEKIIISDHRIKQLKSPIYHETFINLEQILEKINLYSTLTAKIKHEKGERGSLRKAVWHGVWTFLRSYVIKRGFLDGREGFMLAVSNAEGAYYKYLKMIFIK